jgi:hypothetical protein
MTTFLKIIGGFVRLATVLRYRYMAALSRADHIRVLLWQARDSNTRAVTLDLPGVFAI